MTPVAYMLALLAPEIRKLEESALAEVRRELAALLDEIVRRIEGAEAAAERRTREDVEWATETYRRTGHWYGKGDPPA